MLIWQKFKFGIFDVDGTLFDNMTISADAFRDVLKNFDLPKDKIKKIYLDTNGMNLNDQLKLVFDKYEIKYDGALIGKLNKEFFGLRDNREKWQNAPLFPGVKKLVEKLNAGSIKIFASSGSNGDEIARRLKNSRILKYFDSVLGGEKIPKGFRHFEEFAKYCGVPMEKFSKNAFFLSDGPNDMALAGKAGILAIGIANTVSPAKLKSAGADIVVSNADDLIKAEF